MAHFFPVHGGSDGFDLGFLPALRGFRSRSGATDHARTRLLEPRWAKSVPPSGIIPGFPQKSDANILILKRLQILGSKFHILLFIFKEFLTHFIR